MINALPALHAMTGCDKTSALYYIGKKRIYDVAKQDLGLCQEITALAINDIESAEEAG